MKFRCAKCSEEHELLDSAWHFVEPTTWWLLTDEERAQSALSSDQCEIVTGDGNHFFIHALLQIPIAERTEPFVWGVWCSLSEKSYLEVCEHWNDPDREKIGPHFGWLCSRIPGYLDTIHLKTLIHQRAVGLRPLVELEQTEHPLAVEQRNGINMPRLQTIVELLVHQTNQS